MYERRITVGCALTITSWALSGALLLVLWGTGDLRAGFTALAAMGVAAVFTVRGFMEARCIELKNAFGLGRDSVTQHATPLRR